MELKDIDALAVVDVPGVGTVLEGRYRIVGELGAGGVGTVFRAEHLKLGHQVALKVLQPHLVTHAQFRPRFEREARALAALAHPHVVAWTDFSYANGCPYLVMELLDGRPLRTDIAKGPIEPSRVRSILRQALGTLVYAHRLGFIHRDLKPDNIFLLDLPTEPDFVKLLDFGFVKLVEVDGADPEKSQLTASGMGMGTPTYMSPEQAWGDKTGPASDLYSLGIIAFEMLTGRRPFLGEIAAIVRQHMTEPLPEITDGRLVASEALDAFLRRATEKKAEDRFASAEAMLTALDALPEPWMVERSMFGRASRSTLPMPAPARTFSARSIGLASAACIATAAVLAWSRSGSAPPREHAERADVNARTVQAVVDASTLATDSVVDAGTSFDVPSAQSVVPSADALGENPFDTRPRLPLLWNANRQLLAGRGLSSGAELAIERWGRSQPDDPRPPLLLAANAARNHDEGRAVSLYLIAYRASADARNDSRMLRDLVHIAAESRSQRVASDALVAVYGRLALAVVDAELSMPEVSSGAHARLLRLRARLDIAEER